MKKRRILSIILSLFISAGALVSINSFNNKETIVDAEETYVGKPEISWNNVDYSRNSGMAWVDKVNDNGIPTEGYCLLVRYESNISAETHFTENLIGSTLVGCNVGDYILVNGVKVKDVDKAIVYCYPLDGFFIYVPYKSITFSDTYEYLTINVLKGMSIDGSAKLIDTRFEYRGLLQSFGNWKINPEPEEKVDGEFSKIDWNNVDYSFTLGQKWCGEVNADGCPMEGYCLLAFFNEVGKTYQESVIGDMMTTGRGVIGIGLNVDYKVKVNGVNLVDVVDAKCYIFPQYGLFFYLPESSLTYNETYQYPVIAIEKGLHFNNVVLDKITFEYRAEIGTPKGWTYIRDESKYNHFPFTQVAPNWNNISLDTTHTQTILQFGTYDDYLKNDRQSDGTNLVNEYSDCGRKMFLNGIPFANYDDCTVSYLHGNCYVYFTFESAKLIPSNGYKVVTLHIEQNLIFYDSMLPEVNLYLFNNEWTLNKPETPEDEDTTTALTFKNVFNQDEVLLNSESKSISGTKAYSLETFGLYFDYKLTNKDSTFTLLFLGKGEKGIKLAFSKNSISLYDATESSSLLGTAEINPFSYNDWYSLLVFTRIVNDKLTICVAVDDITYIHVDNVTLASKTNLGEQFIAQLETGEVNLRTAVFGRDNKKPVITYTGKSVYSVLTGSDCIDFTNKCSALDKVDGDVSKSIVAKWPEGSLSNNKINKGLWIVTLTAKDKANNEASYDVVVIAADKLDVTVTFDGVNPVSYKVGDHVACVADPVKEEAGKTYKFIGWYYNDRLWDFENDYLISDINLESKFQEISNEHSVIFLVEGLKDTNSFILFFNHGSTVDLSIFKKDGYTLKCYVDGTEVNQITVNKNMEVKLVYSNGSEPTKKGCQGSLTSYALLTSFISGACLILLVCGKKKGGKEHE